MRPKSFDSPDFSASDEAKLVVDSLTAGPKLDVPPEAKPAPRCQCEKNGNEPWLERDLDGYLHCSRCGADY